MQDRWANKIDLITSAFKTEFGSLSVEQLNWKPNPQTWSIAQNIHHLIVINQSYYPVINAVRAGNYKTPFIGKVGFMVNFFGKMLLTVVQPDRKRKMKTFAIWEPKSSDFSTDIIKDFEAEQAALKQLIATCGNLLNNGTVICSPANKNIVYKLETAFDIIIAHEQRHFEQAKEVFAAQKKGTGN